MPPAKTAELDLSCPPAALEVPEAATRQAVRELLPLLYRQVRSLAGPRPDLDDLVQAAAERALKALPNFEGRSAFSTWTYSIAYRTVQDHDRWYRRWARRFSLSEQGTEPEPECPRESTEAQLLQLRRAGRLHAHLEALTPTKRAVIVLHDLEELSVQEIAEIVGAPPATVRSRLRDGRKKLGELLAEDDLFNPTPASLEHSE